MFTKIRLRAGRLNLGGLTLLFVFLCGAQLCLATTVHVPGEQPTIQAWIDAAMDGDTLTLRGTPEGPYQSWFPECWLPQYFRIMDCEGTYSDYAVVPETPVISLLIINALVKDLDVMCTGVVSHLMACEVLTVYEVIWEPCPCEPKIWGDVNDDCAINPVDVVVLVNHVYLGNDMRVQPPNCPYEAGDANCDGDVNPADVVLYVNYVYLLNDLFCPDPCGE